MYIYIERERERERYIYIYTERESRKSFTDSQLLERISYIILPSARNGGAPETT